MVRVSRCMSLIYICRIRRARPEMLTHRRRHGVRLATSAFVPVVQERRSLRERSAQAEQPNGSAILLRGQDAYRTRSARA